MRIYRSEPYIVFYDEEGECNDIDKDAYDDGFYEEDELETLCFFVKFYDDGTVYTDDTVVPIDEMMVYLKTDFERGPNHSFGQYTTNEKGSVSFTTTSPSSVPIEEASTRKKTRESTKKPFYISKKLRRSTK